MNFTADLAELCIQDILQETREISYYIYDNFLYYGIVSSPPYRFVAGPVSELHLSEKDLKETAFRLNLKQHEIPLFVSEMKALSGIHLDTLIQSLILYNFAVNQTMYNISDIRIKHNE